MVAPPRPPVRAPLLALLPLVAAAGREQAPSWVGGYARELAGEVIEYESALPEVSSALLVRSIDAERWIEWESEPAPAKSDVQGASFVWLFGMDADPERHRFELHVDGAPTLAVTNPPDDRLEPWTVEGEGGARLVLRPTRVDRHGDVFGFAVLSLPPGRLTPGRPLRLRLVGESAGSPIWAMTFRASPRATARVRARDALLRGEDRPWQPVVLEVVHLGEATEAELTTSFGAPRRVPLTLGLNRLELPHAAVDAPVEETLALRLPGVPAYDLRCRVEPVRPWTVHLVQHTHTDLGYTRPQTEILPDHLRYVDYALDYCDLTDDLPDDARFRWTCEASWPVAEYLRFRPPEQVERLRRRVAEGRIELTALFANLSELLDERSLAASLEPLRALRAHGLPCLTAVQDDVNGVAWSLADLLPDLGVRYLVMGEHGHRALIPFERPTAFWWESPSGARLLAWRPDHYMTGNFWGLHGGQLEAVEPPLFSYLEQLAEQGYPHDRVAVQYSGVFLDNAPPSTVACRLIEAWNERYVWPHLRSATLSELPRHLEREAAEELETVRAAWPDWWSDGVGSAPREAAAARVTQARLTAVEGLDALALLSGVAPDPELRRRLDWARERLVLYGEHTYGAAESVRDPLAENSQVQWSEKAAYAWEAVKETALLEEAAWGRLGALLARTDAPVVTVVNTLGWSRSGPAPVFVDHALLPPGRAFRLLDEGGGAVPMQLDRPGHDGSWWLMWAADVPALGARRYRLEVGDELAAPVAPVADATRLENRFYRVELDPRTGALTSLVDRELGLELVDPDAPWGFGRLVHETLGNRWQLERFRLDDFERAALTPARLEPGPAGAVWRSVTLRGGGELCPGDDGFAVELRLFEHAKRLELRYRVRKRRSFDPEGLYAAFPFALDGARVVYETAGGVADPERDLLSGTSSDWQAVQRFVSLESPAARVTLSSPEALLVQLGGLQLGRFQRRARVERPHVYSWLSNNYWVTNFLASAEGELAWSHALTSGPPADREAPTRFGWGVQTPLLTRVLPPSTEPCPLPPPQGLLTLSAPNVLLVGARPTRDGAGLLLHLREVAGRATELAVRRADGRPLSLRRVDALGDPLGEAGARVPLRALQTVLVRAELRTAPDEVPGPPRR